MPAAVEMDVAVGPEAEGARRATGASGPTATSRATTPDPEVPAKVQRRHFTAEYRLRILKQADACKKPGELGALLRREGLYSSHLANWRRRREQGALVSLRARKRGPTARPIDPRVTQLEAENARLQRKLQRADTIITLPKKWPCAKVHPHRDESGSVGRAKRAGPRSTPDLFALSPGGGRVYVTLRGPNPLTGNNPQVNNAQGSTPGLGVIQIKGTGQRGTLHQIVRISNVDAGGVERADPHGIAVRLR